MQKRRITIETHRESYLTQRLSSCPIILDFSTLKGHCRLGPSHPAPRDDNNWRLTAFGIVGVVTLWYEEETFFVFWGNDPGPWSCIQTLNSVKSISDFAIKVDANDDEVADAVVRHLRRKEHARGVRELLGIFTAFPSTWGPSERQGAPQVVVGLVNRLAVRRYYNVVEFIDRRVPRMELTAKVIPKERAVSSPRARRSSR